MYGTVESIHAKLSKKVSSMNDAMDSLADVIVSLRTFLRTRRKTKDELQIIDSVALDPIRETINEIYSEYSLSTVNVLIDYYNGSFAEDMATKEYYRIITCENYFATLGNQCTKIRNYTNTIGEIIYNRGKKKSPETTAMSSAVDVIVSMLNSADANHVNFTIKRKNYEICSCGEPMTVIAELSRMYCAVCNKTKNIIGVVFRDDQFYPQEGQKTKHSGYDTNRHYRFWMERLQALESKTFSDEDLAAIEAVIKRDGYNRRTLNCKRMREILKDPAVSSTHLNDHAPLLVKMFGGIPPPQLDFHEHRLCAIKFATAMKLYDTVNPDGGNKPYYPYFIYKIIESVFKNDREKLRLIDYIHLQSRETVIKNDRYYKMMCDLITDDVLVYTPTDPAGRL